MLNSILPRKLGVGGGGILFTHIYDKKQCRNTFCAHIQPRAVHGALIYIIPGLRGAYSTSCSHVSLAACRTTISISLPPGTHLHPSEVNNLRVKCLAHGHNTDSTMSQR